MKKVAIVLLLGSLSLSGESILDQLKKGLAEAQKLTKDVLKLKNDLDTCNAEKSRIEKRETTTIKAKDSAYKTLLAEKNALDKKVKTLEAQLKKQKDQLSKRITPTGPPPIPAGALDAPTAPPPAPTIQPAERQPSGRRSGLPAGRQELLESIKRGTQLKPVKSTGKKSTGRPGGKKTLQEQLAEQLGKRRGSLAEEEDEEDNNGDWE